MKLQLENIIAFVSVAEEGSFSGAARRLNKSQSTISTAVQNLETDVGYSLFHREKKRPYLSEKGQKLFDSSLVLLKQYKEVIAVAKKMNDSTPMTLTLGIDPFLYHPSVMQLLSEFADAFPQLDLVVKQAPSNTLCDDIYKGNIDLAFGFLSNERVYNIEYADLFKLNCNWVHAPRYPFSNSEQPLRTLMLNNNSDMYLPNLETAFSTWKVDDITTLVTLCHQAKGLALLPEHIYQPYTNNGTLMCLHDQRFFGRQLQASLFWHQSLTYPMVADWILTYFAAQK